MQALGRLIRVTLEADETPGHLDEGQGVSLRLPNLPEAMIRLQ